MAKNQPGPRVTITRLAAPDAAPVHEVQAALVASAEQVAQLAPPPLAVVPPAPRVARVELLSDRIVLTNPTIKLDKYIFPPGSKEQTDKLTPTTAVIMHGEIIIEEMGLIWPVSGAHIRTR